MAKRKPNTSSPRPDRRLDKPVEPGLGGRDDSLDPKASFQPFRNVILLHLLLLLLVFVVFLPCVRNDFVEYDDNVYVTENSRVQGGLSWENIKWSFYSTAGGNYWHPLTWLSHMTDCQMFGLKPWGHHLTSVLFHAADTVLVFLVFRGLTGALWRSFMVAALFGLHPLHVESVAWVAERKDVLSAFFWLLTMWAYGKYVNRFKVQGSKFKVYYVLALVFFALGLMSKPMVVTLPCVLLLLDYWPLRRNAECGVRSAELPNAECGVRSAELKNEANSPRSLSWARLALEKTPFFLLAGAGSVAAYVVQKGGGAMWSNLSLSTRMENAPVSYVRYLEKTFWPANLAVFYPHPGQWPMTTVVMSVLLLGGVTVVVFLMRRESPYLLTGWLWFVGTLVPVIGLVQVGEQAMADRYMYLPSIGLFIMLAWGFHDLLRGRNLPARVSWGLATAMLVVCVALSSRQISFWRDTETLFAHAVSVTKDNWLAENNLGLALGRKGRLDEAVSHLEESLKLNPLHAKARNNLGLALTRKGRLDEAISQFQEAIRLKPNDAETHNNLGMALGLQGRVEEAIGQLEEAIKLQPSNPEAHNNLAIALGRKGRLDEAVVQLEEALRLKPDDPELHNNLGRALSRKGRLDEAKVQFTMALKLRPNYPDAERQLRTLTGASPP